CINLFVGGNVFANAYRNSLSDERCFELEMNGQSVGFRVSLKEALLNRTWDVITVQQMSLDSVNYDTYQPYLNRLLGFIDVCAPKSKIALQQTWAYNEGHPSIKNELGFEDRYQMYDAIRDAYDRAASDIEPDFFIPSGALIERLLESDIGDVYQDGSHVSRGLGRFALGLLWYRTLTGRPIDNIDFRATRDPLTDIQIKSVKECVNAVSKEYGIG
ncbi:MAG: DUF4886 domain-containing protein, partial [Clostridia bacterium]|nr:DUF4886 domain-containing protein [Clostridia bacterium]